MKVAIIGAGRQGHRHALSIAQTNLGILHSVYDVDANRARVLAESYNAKHSTSVDNMLADKNINAIVITTPVASHYDLAMKCLNAGKHVFCEKPLTIESSQAELLAQEADTKGLILQCAFIMRHHPAMKIAKKWIDEGRLGGLTYARCDYARSKNFAGTWRSDKAQSGGGNLHDQAIHVLDLFRWYMGEFVKGQCYTSTTVWDMAPLEDSVVGMMRASSGALASFHVSYARWSPYFALEIGGTNGVIRIEGLGNNDYGKQSIKLVERNDSTGLGNEREQLEFFDVDSPWNNEWREFCDAVETGRRPNGDGYEGVQALKLVELLYGSADYVNIRSDVE